MNQITIGGLTAVGPAGRPNQRALAKQRTREKILTAAKALFSERGYERATIRDIAKAAGMSTGAVFASFTDKSDLFVEIVETEHAALHEAMRAAGEGLTGRAAIVAMLDAAAERQMGELALIQAVMSALWTPGLGAKVRRRLDRRPVVGLIEAAVREDAACGGCADAALIADMAWDAYLSVLRRASLDGLTLERVKAGIREQLRTILAGARRG